MSDSIPTVRYDTSFLTADVLEELEADIRTIPGVTLSNFDDIYDIALTAVSRGGDLHILTHGLIKHIDGMQRNVSANYARWLTFRTQQRGDINRKLSLGITKVKWLYANAPCYERGQPSEADLARDASHKAADGKKFKVADGLKIKGVVTWPGMERGCKCSMISIIPGFSD